MTRTVHITTGAVAAAAALAIAVPALARASPSATAAATKNGITPVAPKAGSTVPVGSTPTFKMRVRGKGQVWVHVCKSRKKRRDGTICSKESIGRARKRGSLYVYKPRFFDFPAFWLNSPGTYYWQAFRIECKGGDCAQEGPIVQFKVA